MRCVTKGYYLIMQPCPLEMMSIYCTAKQFSHRKEVDGGCTKHRTLTLETGVHIHMVRFREQRIVGSER